MRPVLYYQEMEFNQSIIEKASLGLLGIGQSRSRHSWYDRSKACVSLYSYNTLSVMPCNHGAGKKLHKFQFRACAACLQTLPVCLKAWSRYVAWTQAPIRDSARHQSQDWLDSHHRPGLTASQSGPNIEDAPVTRNLTKKKLFYYLHEEEKLSSALYFSKVKRLTFWQLPLNNCCSIQDALDAPRSNWHRASMNSAEFNFLKDFPPDFSFFTRQIRLIEHAI